MMNLEHVPSSFRDPSGFVFCHEGSLYRQISHQYKLHYEALRSSGLYEALVEKGLLIEHREVDLSVTLPDDTFRVIQPDVVSFISYPFEWCFSQLKAAALATLELQKTALDYGLTLKDASAYNIQFIGTRPVLIDTLSFEKYKDGSPWIAYRQFCQHFLAIS